MIIKNALIKGRYSNISKIYSDKIFEKSSGQPSISFLLIPDSAKVTI